MNKNYLIISTLLFLVSFIGYFNNLIIAPLLNNMALDLNLSVASLGFLVTLYGVTAGIMSLVIGPFSDKFGRKNTIILFASLTAITSLLFSFSWDFTTLLIFRFLNAMTAGPLIFCAIASVGDYIPLEKRGSVTGVVTSSMFIGTIVGVPLSLLLLKHPVLNWRATFYLISLFSLITSLLVIFFLPRNESSKTNHRTTVITILKHYFSFFRNKKYLGFLTIFLLLSFSVGTFITYYPTYLLNNRSLTLNGLILVYSIGGSFALFFNIMAGKFSDKLNRKSMIISGSFTIALMMLAIINIPTSSSTILAAVLIISVTYMSAEAFRTTPLQTEALVIVPVEFRGIFLGSISFLMAIGTSLGAAFSSTIISLKKASFIEALKESSQAITPQIESQLIGYELITYVSIATVLLSIVLIFKFVKKKQGPRHENSHYYRSCPGNREIHGL